MANAELAQLVAGDLVDISGNQVYGDRDELEERMSNALHDQARIILAMFGQPQQHDKIRTVPGGGIEPEPQIIIPDKYGIDKLNVLAYALTHPILPDDKTVPATFLKTPEVRINEEQDDMNLYSIQEKIEQAPDHAVRRIGVEVLVRNPEIEESKGTPFVTIYSPTKDSPAHVLYNSFGASPDEIEKAFTLLISIQGTLKAQAANTPPLK